MARPREFEESAVVAAAMAVFWDKGYEATSVQDLVDATGLKRGSLYGAFGDKRGLFIAALQAYMDERLEQFQALFRLADDPMAAVRGFVLGGDATDPLSIRRGCMVGNTCSEVDAHTPEIRAMLRRFIDGVRDEIADALRRGQACGSFAADRNPDAVAAFIVASIEGVTMMAKAGFDPSFSAAVKGEIARVLGPAGQAPRPNHEFSQQGGTP